MTDQPTNRPTIVGRPLLSVRLRDGRTATATTSGLVITDADAPAESSTRWWSDVDTAQTDPAALTLTITWVDGTTVELPFDPDGSKSEQRAIGRFGTVVREAVRSSVVHTRDVALPTGQKVRIAIRRDEDGSLFSQVLGRVDLTEPRTRALVDAAEAAARETVGLPA